MNLQPPSGPEPIQRALLAKDAAGTVRVLATDGAGIGWDVRELSTDAEEVGLVDADAFPAAGLFLWEGTSRMEHESWESFGPPTELVYDGKYRPVQPDEALGLWAMKPPPEPAEEEQP